MPPIRRRTALVVTLLLAACASDPASRCAPAETRELRTIDRLIAETRADIARGYRSVRTGTNPSVNLCLGGYENNVGASFCANPGAQIRTEALDTAAATRTLEALLARRERLEAQIAAAIAACPAR